MNELLTLAAALNALDAGNDEHWTKTGLPKLKVLKELTGNDDLTVAMVNERLYDGYNRVNAAAAPSFIDPPTDGTHTPDEGPKDNPDNDDEQAVAEEIDAESADVDAIQLMEAACAACQTDRYRRNNELQGMVRMWQVSQFAIRDLQDRLDLRTERKATANAEENARLAEAEE